MPNEDYRHLNSLFCVFLVSFCNAKVISEKYFCVLQGFTRFVIIIIMWTLFCSPLLLWPCLINCGLILGKWSVSNIYFYFYNTFHMLHCCKTAVKEQHHEITEHTAFFLSVLHDRMLLLLTTYWFSLINHELIHQIHQRSFIIQCPECPVLHVGDTCCISVRLFKWK